MLTLIKGPIMAQTTITPEQFTQCVAEVTKVWTDSKLFSTKADKQTMLIINSKHTYATIINTQYSFSNMQYAMRIEQLYSNKQFAQDVTTAVMQKLLLG